jgi:hypothetical protein
MVAMVWNLGCGVCRRRGLPKGDNVKRRENPTLENLDTMEMSSERRETAVSVAGYVFDGAVENGGDGLKLGMWRVEAARVAKRRQREATREPDTGKPWYNGDVVREKGDCYLIDTTVAGNWERWRDIGEPQVIKHRGSNQFMHEESFHTGVRHGFYNTDTGIRRKHILVE